VERRPRFILNFVVDETYRRYFYIHPYTVILTAILRVAYNRVTPAGFSGNTGDSKRIVQFLSGSGEINWP